MSSPEVFMEPIDPEHALTRAARELDSLADEQGIEMTVEQLGLGLPTEQLMYLAHQRAIRNEAAKRVFIDAGMNNEQAVEYLRVLMIQFTDAVAIGWRAREIAHGNSPIWMQRFPRSDGSGGW
jgi:hypothetical protein